MRYKILVIGILCLFVFVTAQSQQWIRVYGDSVNTITNNVYEHYDKGYIFTGKLDEGWTSYGWLMKTDINGYKLWNKTYGLPGKINPIASSRLTNDGGIIAIGGTNSLSASCNDPIIYKIDPCGEKEWCKIYNAPGCNGWGTDIELIYNGGYMALFDRWKSGYEELIWLFRLDSIGDVIWTQAFVTNPDFSSEWSHSLLKTTDTCFVITGEAYYPDPTYPNKSIIKIILIKVNIDGDAIFEVPWGTNNGVYSDGRLSTIDSHNNIYTAGRRARTTAPYGDSPCLFKTSVSGEPVFYKDLKPTSSLGMATTVNWFQDSTLVQCFGWVNQSGNDTTALIKTDSLGNVMIIKSLLINSVGSFYGSDITFNNRLILAGRVYNAGVYNTYAYKLNSNLDYDSVYTTPFTYDSLCPHPIGSDTIPLDDCQVVVVGLDEAEMNPEKTRLKVYPNPAKNQVTIEMPQYLVRKTQGSGITATTTYYQWDKTRLDVFNLSGRLMFSQDIPKKHPAVQINTFTWPAGIYFARVVFRNEVVTTEKFIIRN